MESPGRKPSLLPGGHVADSRILHGAISKLRGRASRDNNKSIVLERAELTDAVRRVSHLRISARTPETCRSKEGVEISLQPESAKPRKISTRIQGRSIAIGFNSSYMLDFSPPPRMAG